MLGTALRPGSKANSTVRAVSLRPREHGFEREALDRAHRFPVLAARALPNESLRAVAAVRAAIARVGHRDSAQTLGDALDRGAALRVGQRAQLCRIHEICQHGMLEHEALDGALERNRAASARR